MKTNFLRSFFSSERGNRADSLLTRRETVQEARSILKLLDWTEVALPFSAKRAGDFAVKKGKTSLICKCGGVDGPVYAVEARDLRRAARESSTIAICIEGGMVAAQCSRIRAETDIAAVSLTELGNLNEILHGLVPVVFGGIDRVCFPRTLGGWACVVPSAEPARVEIYVNSDLWGSALADTVRRDLSDFNEGFVGFRVELAHDLDNYLLHNSLIARVLKGSRTVGKVFLWGKAIIE